MEFWAWHLFLNSGTYVWCIEIWDIVPKAFINIWHNFSKIIYIWTKIRKLRNSFQKSLVPKQIRTKVIFQFETQKINSNIQNNENLFIYKKTDIYCFLLELIFFLLNFVSLIFPQGTWLRIFKVHQKLNALLKASEDREFSLEGIFSKEQIKNRSVVFFSSFPVCIRHCDLV